VDKYYVAAFQIVRGGGEIKIQYCTIERGENSVRHKGEDHNLKSGKANIKVNCLQRLGYSGVTLGRKT
jgi:hypothetical protein